MESCARAARERTNRGVDRFMQEIQGWKAFLLSAPERINYVRFPPKTGTQQCERGWQHLRQQSQSMYVDSVITSAAAPANQVPPQYPGVLHGLDLFLLKK